MDHNAAHAVSPEPPQVAMSGTTLVPGATGSGKSFLLNSACAHHPSANSPRTLIFDPAGATTGLTRYSAGTCGMGLDRPGYAINPFCLEPTPANLQFLFTVPMSGGRHAMSRGRPGALRAARDDPCARPGAAACLHAAANILLRAAGSSSSAGCRAANARGSSITCEDTVDARRVSDRGLREASTRCRPCRSRCCSISAPRARRRSVGSATPPLKVFVLDEAWRFLRDPTIRAYVTEALKTIGAGRTRACWDGDAVERGPGTVRTAARRDRELSDACVPG